jgi:PAS domain S-box-containing protein
MLKDKITRITGRGIAKKFIIWTVAIIVLLDILAAIFMEIDLNRTLSEDLNERGQTLSRHLAIESGGGELLSTQDKVNLQQIIENIMITEKDVKYAYITDPAGNVVAHTFGSTFPRELLTASNDSSNSPKILDLDFGHIIEFKAPIPGERGGLVHLGFDRTPVDEKTNRATYIIFASILLEGGLGIIMAFIAGNYLARPIRSLVKGAEEIGKGNLGYQINVGTTDDEVYTLSNAFNQMSYNLNKSVSDLRQLSTAVEEAPDCIQITDLNGYILYSNKAAEGIFGFSAGEFRGKHIKEIHANPEFVSSVIIPHIKETGRWVGELVARNRGGREFPIWLNTSMVRDSQGNPIAMVGVIRDLTERKEMEKLEKQILQSDKLTTIGLLAAGIAHEINNPLGNISLYAQMLSKKATDENTRSKLAIINDEANRAALIVKELLDFSRPSEPEKSPIDINKEIGKVLSILSLQLKDLSVRNPLLKDIRITTDLGHLPLIQADSGQIKQVIMNILTNSVQSVAKNGEIMVRTVAKEDFVEIIISDNGCGIPEENLNKIFDPFFTTKEQGRGTGLGLSISHGIIKRHNGSIEVKSETGKGTTFTIKLPA